MLETRASGWAEHRRAKEQPGFLKDHCTSEQVFVKQALVRQAKQPKHALCCCYVDLKKAFDLVPRQT